MVSTSNENAGVPTTVQSPLIAATTGAAPIAGMPPQQHVLTLLAGKMISASVCVLARVGIADLLTAGPRSVADLAEQSRTHAPTLYRFLRAAAAAGVFAEQPDGTFALTPSGELLRSDVPGSLRYLAYLYGETSVWNCFGDAIETLRTGEPSGPKLRGGMGWFEYMDASEEYAEVFHRAMTGLNNHAPVVAAAYDFGQFARIADIGGGQGKLLSEILRQYPDSTGLLFDIASAIDGAPKVLAEHDVAQRTECVVGDFFSAVPAGQDAYVLRAILHDWNDEDSGRILGNIRTAIGADSDARVLIVEAVVPDLNEWHFSKAMDIAMGVSLGGKERNTAQWRELLSSAGFELVEIIRTAPPHCIVVARPS